MAEERARPGTPAAVMEDQIPGDVMDERLQRLQERINAHRLAFNRSKVGTNTQILIERTGKFLVNVKVRLDDLAREGAEAAAFLVGALVGDVVIRPLPKRVEVVEAGESLTAMEREDAPGLPRDDC